MAKFSNQRKGGRTYNVRVSDTKHGETVGMFTVTATDVRKARAAACEAAIHRVIDTTRLYAHGPVRA
jgi:hypothetical protein